MKISRFLDTSKVPQQPVNQTIKREPSGSLLEHKIQELIEVIGQSQVDSSSAKHYQQQIADAFQKSVLTEEQLAPFKSLDQDNNLSREELLEGLEKMLSESKIDSKMSSSYLRHTAIQNGVMCIVALLLVIVGFAMIIMPAPPSFELFTIFYFNPNDGVTIMDLVSLLIIFGGVLLFVLNFNKK